MTSTDTGFIDRPDQSPCTQTCASIGVPRIRLSTRSLNGRVAFREAVSPNCSLNLSVSRDQAFQIGQETVNGAQSHDCSHKSGDLGRPGLDRPAASAFEREAVESNS
jgi:hypothetical protein